MLYQDARPHIQSGDLIAFSGKAGVGGLIRSWTGASYSHVGIACWFDIDGIGKRLALIESKEGKGVTIRALSQAGPFYWVTHEGKWGYLPFEFAWTRAGVANYDWTSVLNRVLGRDPVRDDQYICSEMAGEILARQGLPISPHDFGDPGRLVDAVLTCGGSITKVMHVVDLADEVSRYVVAARHLPQPA
ncbi:MAG: hypothetical protein AB7G35_06545 [Hyphomicrobiaceae bacterium]